MQMRHQHTSDALRLFVAWFWVLTVMFAVYALPELLVRTGAGNAVVDFLGSVIVYASCVILIQIPAVFLNRREAGVVAGIIITTIGLVYCIGIVLSPEASIRETFGPYVFWWPQTSQWLRAMTGIVAGITTFSFVLTFFLLGVRAHSDKIVRRRSFSMAGGMLALLITAVSVLTTTGAHTAFDITRLIMGAVLMVLGTSLLYYSLLSIPSDNANSTTS
jgi:hypothetical protein